MWTNDINVSSDVSIMSQGQVTINVSSDVSNMSQGQVTISVSSDVSIRGELVRKQFNHLVVYKARSPSVLLRSGGYV